MSTYSINESRASFSNRSISSVVRRGLMQRASCSSYSSCSISTCGLSLGITIVPDDFRLPNFGLCNRLGRVLVGFWETASSLIEEAEDEDGEEFAIGSATMGMAEGGAVVEDMVHSDSQIAPRLCCCVLRPGSSCALSLLRHQPNWSSRCTWKQQARPQNSGVESAFCCREGDD
jgi:hypothetical protein